MADSVVVDLFILLFKTFLVYVQIIYRWFRPIQKVVRGRLVLVTGAGGGIGREIAREFSRKGAKLVLLDINKEGNKETADLIREHGGEAHTYSCDVSSAADIARVAEEVVNRLGNVDILVNNAGVLVAKDILSLSDNEIKRTFDINIMAHFWTVREFLPGMIKQKDGHVVTIASGAGKAGSALLTDYCASKFAALGYTQALAEDIRRRGWTGIKTTTVMPMFANTNLLHKIEGQAQPGSRFDPLLSASEIAQATVQGVISEKLEVYIPKRLYFFSNYLLPFVPQPIANLITDFLRMAFYEVPKKEQ